MTIGYSQRKFKATMALNDNPGPGNYSPKVSNKAPVVKISPPPGVKSLKVEEVRLSELLLGGAWQLLY